MEELYVHRSGSDARGGGALPLDRSLAFLRHACLIDQVMTVALVRA